VKTLYATGARYNGVGTTQHDDEMKTMKTMIRAPCNMMNDGIAYCWIIVPNDDAMLAPANMLNDRVA
jgi:hypothetical protein